MQDEVSLNAIRNFRRKKLSKFELDRFLRSLVFSPSGKARSVKDVSDLLYLSTRTFNRRLNEAGMSYSHICDAVKKEKAIHLLCSTNIPIGEISRRVGYTESANFSKAFKRWTGSSPKEYARMARVWSTLNNKPLKTYKDKEKQSQKQLPKHSQKSPAVSAAGLFCIM